MFTVCDTRDNPIGRLGTYAVNNTQNKTLVEMSKLSTYIMSDSFVLDKAFVNPLSFQDWDSEKIALINTDGTMKLQA